MTIRFSNSIGVKIRDITRSRVLIALVLPSDTRKFWAAQVQPVVPVVVRTRNFVHTAEVSSDHVVDDEGVTRRGVESVTKPGILIGIRVGSVLCDENRYDDRDPSSISFKLTFTS